MKAQVDCQDVIANNLANVSTPGFKRSSVSFASIATQFQQAVPNPMTPMPPHAPCAMPTLVVQQDTKPGMIQDTGSPTSLAVEGSGSFVVQTPAGERLTRCGDFGLDSTGQLITSDAYPVLGQSGPISITSANWTVSRDGSVIIDNSIVDKLRIESAPGVPVTDPDSVYQGRLEASNVNAVQEMVSMISVLRAYEANQKSIQAVDQTLDKVINQMARFA